MSRWREAVRIALLDLRTNVIRSGLSLSGVVIGISAVTLIVALGAGMRRLVYQKFTAMGLLEYRVYPSYDERTRRMGELEPEDVRRLEALPLTEAVLPETTMWGESVRSEHAAAEAAIDGISPPTGPSLAPFIVEGRSFYPLEIEGRDPVCLLSQRLAGILFPGLPAAGRTLWVKGTPWTVVGVFRTDASHALGGRNPDSVLLPLTALLRQFPDAKVRSLTVRAKESFSGDAVAEIRAALSREDPRRRNLHHVSSWKSFMDARASAVRNLTWVGALIAVISLLVGEIGVMNVMLTSVAERTREIGLRRALGARKLDILGQFLVESSLLSGLGGLLGLTLGMALAQAFPPLWKSFSKEELSVAFSPLYGLLALAASSLLGALFGVYPASKAARLSPAAALRAE